MKKITITLFVFVFLLSLFFLTKEDNQSEKSALMQSDKIEKKDQSLTLQGEKNRYGYTDISSDVLASAFKNKDFTLINVHIPYEGEIPNTDEFVPYNEIVKNKNLLPKDKNKPIVVYCRSGAMSAKAARELVLLGYKNVYNLKKGMIEWQSKGYNLIVKN